MKISFVIPAYNEENYIKACLQSITCHCKTNNIDAEILVIDNGSTDNTAYLAKHSTDNVYSIERSSVSYARNYGVHKASNEIIAFIDGDVEITDTWIKCFKSYYSKFVSNPNFLTGHQCAVPENGGWIEQYWFKNLTDKFLGGANIITSIKVFNLLNGFDVNLETGEDYDLCIRSIDAGVNYFTDPEFKAIHLGFPNTLYQFLRREYWHGKGDFITIKRFVKSQVAMIAVGYLLLHTIAIIFLIMGNILIPLSLLVTLFLLNFLITYKRFSKCNLRIIFVNSFLNYAYLCARGTSLLSFKRQG